MQQERSDVQDDCPLAPSVQTCNIVCLVAFWGISYLCAPVSYIGLTHANLLKALDNTDTISNLPVAVYQWLIVVPVVAAWWFPHPRHLKPLAVFAISGSATATAIVAAALAARAAPSVVTATVIAHAAVFGISSGVMMTVRWELIKRGLSTSRRGRALGFVFAIGPLCACVGAVLQDALFEGKLTGGHSFGLKFPQNYLAMFAAVAPLLLLECIVVGLFQLPKFVEPVADSVTTSGEILTGLRQFLQNRAVWTAILIYVVVYSGGNAIFSNVSLHAKSLLPDEANTLGIQSFLRFGSKAAAGALLGWLLAYASPRATLLATTLILLLGIAWALGSTGWWFLATFGLLGAGELFGAYFPNYITTASQEKYVRVNLAYMNVMGILIGFSALLFGVISDNYGRVASFYVSAGLLAVAIVLICLLLPAHPSPRETAEN